MRLLGCVGVLLMLSACLFAQSERVIVFPVFPPLDTTAGVYVKNEQSGRLVPTNLKGLEVVEMRVEGQTVTPGQTFSAPGDWLKSLHMKLKNVSGRWISSVRLSLVLPEAKVGEVSMGFTLEYGAALRTAPNSIVNPEMPIDPGKTIELGLTDARYEFIIAGVVKRTGVVDYKTLWVRGVTVVFDDGTVWFDHKVPFATTSDH